MYFEKKVTLLQIHYTIAVQDILASTMPLRHAFKKTDDDAAAAAAVEVVKAEKCALIA